MTASSAQEDRAAQLRSKARWCQATAEPWHFGSSSGCASQQTVTPRGAGHVVVPRQARRYYLAGQQFHYAAANWAALQSKSPSREVPVQHRFAGNPGRADAAIGPLGPRASGLTHKGPPLQQAALGAPREQRAVQHSGCGVSKPQQQPDPGGNESRCGEVVCHAGQRHTDKVPQLWRGHLRSHADKDPPEPSKQAQQEPHAAPWQHVRLRPSPRGAQRDGAASNGTQPQAPLAATAAGAVDVPYRSELCQQRACSNVPSSPYSSTHAPDCTPLPAHQVHTQQQATQQQQRPKQQPGQGAVSQLPQQGISATLLKGSKRSAGQCGRNLAIAIPNQSKRMSNQQPAAQPCTFAPGTPQHQACARRTHSDGLQGADVAATVCILPRHADAAGAATDCVPGSSSSRVAPTFPSSPKGSCTDSKAAATCLSLDTASLCPRCCCASANCDATGSSGSGSGSCASTHSATACGEHSSPKTRPLSAGVASERCSSAACGTSVAAGIRDVAVQPAHGTAFASRSSRVRSDMDACCPPTADACNANALPTRSASRAANNNAGGSPYSRPCCVATARAEHPSPVRQQASAAVFCGGGDGAIAIPTACSAGGGEPALPTQKIVAVVGSGGVGACFSSCDAASTFVGSSLESPAQPDDDGSSIDFWLVPPRVAACDMRQTLGVLLLQRAGRCSSAAYSSAYVTACSQRSTTPLTREGQGSTAAASGSHGGDACCTSPGTACPAEGFSHACHVHAGNGDSSVACASPCGTAQGNEQTSREALTPLEACHYPSASRGASPVTACSARSVCSVMPSADAQQGGMDLGCGSSGADACCPACDAVFPAAERQLASPVLARDCCGGGHGGSSCSPHSPCVADHSNGPSPGWLEPLEPARCQQSAHSITTAAACDQELAMPAQQAGCAADSRSVNTCSATFPGAHFIAATSRATPMNRRHTARGGSSSPPSPTACGASPRSPHAATSHDNLDRSCCASTCSCSSATPSPPRWSDDAADGSSSTIAACLPSVEVPHDVGYTLPVVGSCPSSPAQCPGDAGGNSSCCCASSASAIGANERLSLGVPASSAAVGCRSDADGGASASRSTSSVPTALEARLASDAASERTCCHDPNPDASPVCSGCTSPVYSQGIEGSSCPTSTIGCGPGHSSRAAPSPSTGSSAVRSTAPAAPCSQSSITPPMQARRDGPTGANSDATACCPSGDVGSISCSSGATAHLPGGAHCSERPGSEALSLPGADEHRSCAAGPAPAVCAPASPPWLLQLEPADRYLATALGLLDDDPREQGRSSPRGGSAQREAGTSATTRLQSAVGCTRAPDPASQRPDRAPACGMAPKSATAGSGARQAKPEVPGTGTVEASADGNGAWPALLDASQRVLAAAFGLLDEQDIAVAAAAAAGTIADTDASSGMAVARGRQQGLLSVFWHDYLADMEAKWTKQWVLGGMWRRR